MGWAEEVLADLPVGWWPCNEGTGAPLDESGNGFDTTLSAGGGTWTTDAPLGDVLAVGDGVWTTTAEIPGGGCTITWASKLTYVANVGDVRVTLDDGGSNYANCRVWSTNSGTTSDIDASTGNATDFVDLNSHNNALVDAWTHYALVVNGTTATLYVNGSSVATDTLSTATAADIAVSFGGNPSNADGGLLGGVAVFDSVLSPTRITAHATAFLAIGDAVSVSPAVIDVAVTTPTARVGVATSPTPTPSWPSGPENAPGWVSTYGEPISIDKPLNSYERAVIRVPDSSAQPAHLANVTITRNGHRHFLGKARNIEDDSAQGHLDHTCFGYWHLFTQRYAGTAQRTNYLDNGHFEDADGLSDLSGWSAVNVTAAAEADVVLSGKQAVRLTNGQTTWPILEPSHYDSAFAKETSPYGSRFYVAAWCFIPGPFLPGHKTFGLRCRYDTGTMQGDVATFIDITHPTNQWTRHYLELPLPPSVTAIVVCELWAPVGDIVWDHVQVVGNTADGSPTPEGSDQCLVAGEFVRAAQFGPGKADLGVARATPLSGINSTEMMIHFQHEQTATKVETMGAREEGFDWHVDTSSGNPIFRTYFPRRGSTGGTLTFPAGNVLQYRRTVTGAEAASSIITTGDANDPAREEGAAWDEAALGGLLLEAVRPIPQGSSIGLLNPKAREYLRQYKEAPQAVDAVLTADDGEDFEPGDIVTFTATRGSAGFSAEYRVVNWHADCPNDTVTLSLVRWIDPDEM